jgi:hypothetical protein
MANCLWHGASVLPRCSFEGTRTRLGASKSVSHTLVLTIVTALIGNPTRRPIQRLTITHFLKKNGKCVKLGSTEAKGLGWDGWDVEPKLPRLILRPLRLEKLCAGKEKRKSFELEDEVSLVIANTLQLAAPAVTR